jgi:hypothetical protein
MTEIPPGKIPPGRDFLILQYTLGGYFYEEDRLAAHR